MDPDLHVTLEEHLSDTLAAISEVNASDNHVQTQGRLHFFIDRRCLRATIHRIEMDRYLFVALSGTLQDDPIHSFSDTEVRLEDVLDVVHSEWDSNGTASQATDVSEWYKVLEEIPGVPSRGVDLSQEQECNIVTGRAWLANLLRRIRELTANKHNSQWESGGPQTKDAERVVQLTENLVVLSSFLKLPLGNMVKIPPIETVLNRCSA